MATLSKQSPSAAGAALTYAAAAAGDKFTNTGREFLSVTNGAGAPITVTIDSPGTCNFGLAANAAHDSIATVAAGVTKLIGPFSVTLFNDANGFCNIVYSSTTTITVAVISAA